MPCPALHHRGPSAAPRAALPRRAAWARPSPGCPADRAGHDQRVGRRPSLGGRIPTVTGAPRPRRVVERGRRPAGVASLARDGYPACHHDPGDARHARPPSDADECEPCRARSPEPASTGVTRAHAASPRLRPQPMTPVGPGLLRRAPPRRGPRSPRRPAAVGVSVAGVGRALDIAAHHLPRPQDRQQRLPRSSPGRQPPRRANDHPPPPPRRPAARSPLLAVAVAQRQSYGAAGRPTAVTLGHGSSPRPGAPTRDVRGRVSQVHPVQVRQHQYGTSAAWHHDVRRARADVCAAPGCLPAQLARRCQQTAC